MSKLAVLGGAPVRDKPFTQWPVHGEEEERNVLGVLRSGKWWYGEKVKAFEAAYAEFQDAAFGISCANGSLAIEVALLAAGIGAGDEVITTPYTFMATAGSILKANAIPVFADVDEATGNLDPDAAEAHITPQTRAIMPVHVAGLPVDVDRFTQIGEKHGVRIIYDAAHGWGSQWRGKGVGAYGAFSTYSFQASKNMTSGEGGIILTCDEAGADTARSYTNCGRSSKGAWYEHFLLGANLRLTEFQAAILLAQIERLKDQTEQRERSAAWLNERFAGFDGLRTIPRDERVTRRAHHMYQLRYDAGAWKDLPRAKFCAAVSAEGVPFREVWPLLYKMPLFTDALREGPKACPISCPYHEGEVQDYGRLNLPNAERVSTRTGVWMAHACLLGDEADMQDVIDAVAKVRVNLDELLGADIGGA